MRDPTGYPAQFLPPLPERTEAVYTSLLAIDPRWFETAIAEYAGRRELRRHAQRGEPQPGETSP